MLTFAFLFGDISYNYFFGNRADKAKGYVILSALSGILLIISGIVNMILLYKEKNYDRESSEYKVWKYILYSKLVLVILLTPLFDKHLSLEFKFYIALSMFLVSPFSRFYREYFIKSIEPSYNKFN